MFFKMDFSHSSFLDEARDDLKAARCLYEGGLYAQAVYHVQQSIEKSSKFWGLTLRMFSYEDLKKLGHNPHKVFKKLFEGAVEMGMVETDLFKRLEDFISGCLSVDERVRKICEKLKRDLNFIFVVIEEGQTPLEALRVFLKEEEDLGIVRNLEELRGMPEWESVCMCMVDKINREARYVTLQMSLSFLVWGLEANTRYPDYGKGTVPSDLYSKDTELVKNMPFFMEVQEGCINALYEGCVRK